MSDTELEFHPLANLFPMIEGDARGELEDDIEAHGLAEPIVMFEGKILDGRNRYLAGAAVGADLIFREYRGDDPVAFVVSANLHRRHLDASQRAMVAAGLATMRQGQRTDLPPQDGRSPAISQEQAAAALNVSVKSVERATVVRDRGVPELQDAVKQGRVPVSTAAEIAGEAPERQQAFVTAYFDSDGNPTEAGKQLIKEVRARQVAQKKARRIEREAELGARQQALPDKRYGVILADPEWSFETFDPDTGADRSASNHYPTSSLEVIKARPVLGIAAPDCVLVLWATVPMLPQALEVVAAWGFTYRSSAAWVKPRAGTGYWFRNRHELLLIGTRGNIPAPAMGTQWSSVLEAPTGRHSEKPDAVYELIEAYFPTLPKIELNARAARDGWDRWGNEAPDES